MRAGREGTDLGTDHSKDQTSTVFFRTRLSFLEIHLKRPQFTGVETTQHLRNRQKRQHLEFFGEVLQANLEKSKKFTEILSCLLNRDFAACLERAAANNERSLENPIPRLELLVVCILSSMMMMMMMMELSHSHCRNGDWCSLDIGSFPRTWEVQRYFLSMVGSP